MEIYQNWWEEARAAYLYSIMADCDPNTVHQQLFRDLKHAAEKQADAWASKMISHGQQPPGNFTPDFRTRLVAWLIRKVGTNKIHTILSAMKIRGMSVFTHYHSEHKHTSFNAASNIRAAVFGINDGLISNASLILGIAGANANQHFILVAGIAGLLAGASSMAAGEYISVRSQREVFEYQINIEKQELSEYPEEEIEELTLIYQARGIPQEEAVKLATLMINNPDTGLATLAREELGLNPEDMVSPFSAMLSSFIAFGIGAFLPLIPYLFSESSWNLPISIMIAAGSLFMIGAILSLFTNRHPVISGLRMLFVGVIAGSLTFLIGKLLGIAMY